MPEQSSSQRVRALPLWQPWASLVVFGFKRVETRPKPAPQSILGTRIVVHACLTRYYGVLVGQPVFREYLSALPLPYGALIGTVRVTATRPMDDDYCAHMEAEHPVEYLFGNYAAGRHAWTLEDPQPLREPVPWKGSQGIFFVPAEVVGAQLPEAA